MITKKEYMKAQEEAYEMIKKSGIMITEKELRKIEVADFGLGDLRKEGAQILTLVSTNRISVKIIALFPFQTEPEHWHTSIGDDPGKEETIRVVGGSVRFYIPGEESISEGFIPKGKEEYYTVRREIIMKPGEQLTLKPGTKHWFQAGSEGTVMYSFSTCAIDALDPFTDPNVVRETKIVD